MSHPCSPRIFLMFTFKILRAVLSEGGIFLPVDIVYQQTNGTDVDVGMHRPTDYGQTVDSRSINRLTYVSEPTYRVR